MGLGDGSMRRLRSVGLGDGSMRRLRSVGLGDGSMRRLRCVGLGDGSMRRLRCVAYKGTREGRGFGRRTLYRPVYSLIVPYTSPTKFLKFSPATLCARIATPQKNFYKISTTPPCASHTTPILSIYTARQWGYKGSKTTRGRYAYKTKTGRTILQCGASGAT